MSEFTIDDNTLNWRGVLYKNLLPREATGGSISVVDSLSPAAAARRAMCMRLKTKLLSF